MPSVCFYFQVHQPFRLKDYDVFLIGNDHYYEDKDTNVGLLNRIADNCYLPYNNLMLKHIKDYDGKFKIAYSLSGIFLDLIEEHRPDVLDSFKALADTGCVEFLSETYYHSLAWLHNKPEFEKQIKKHRQKIYSLFKQRPTVFRNTELIYNNDLAQYIAKLGYKTILCEGVDRLLDGRKPNFVYKPAGSYNINVLLKNYRLSDDVAFRFGDQAWDQWPLMAETFAHWIHSVAGNGETINLFMDYETFGEHQKPETGIYDFMLHLPEKIFAHPDFDFKTPSEVSAAYTAREVYDAPEIISWADLERDTSAWDGNSMQQESLRRVYDIGKLVQKLNDDEFTETWGKLQTSDHFYYMSTKYWADGNIHKYFSPYKSPYDAYLNYMNVLTDFELTLQQHLGIVKDVDDAPVL